MDFDLSKITGKEPPVKTDVDLKTCGVCDEHIEDGLEACSECYSSVWADMVAFEEKTETESTEIVVAALRIFFKAEKKSPQERTVYTAKSIVARMSGKGMTKALALADLLAKIWLQVEEP